MENQHVDKDQSSPDDSCQLNRNRSFKSKQLVRSQALRETHSPPRTVSPTAITYTEPVKNTQYPVKNQQNPVKNQQYPVKNQQYPMQSSENPNDIVRTNLSDITSQSSDCLSDSNNKLSDRVSSYGYSEDGVKNNVEIQITSNTWESEPEHEDNVAGLCSGGADLLSNHPRVTCVCDHCPHCRGRRKLSRGLKQDSGIGCPDDCPDCDDNEHTEDGNQYCRCTERKEKPKNTSLSRSDSDEKSDLTSVDLVTFIKCTLNKNCKDRMTLLRIEKELHSLVNDKGRCVVRFPVMTSYGRMLVHRVAALYQLAHHLDPNNKSCVLVSKNGTSGGRIPCTNFKQWCTVNFPQSPNHTSQDAQAKSILKRSSHSLDEVCRRAGDAGSRSKSLEQRELEYERVRRRIFAQDQQNDESQWPWLPGPLKLLTPDNGRNKLLKVQSLECEPLRGERSERGVVSKSHSFAGDEPRTARLLSRQGDLAASNWRLSPSSSGYKTLSLRSTDSITPSPTDEMSGYPGCEGVVWCVTDLSHVPEGALLIHPKSGRALTNPDGSIYHYDPNNPPVIYDNNAHIYNAEDNNEKRRGRLEKQNSFIDNECESQSTEECRNKNCYCSCRTRSEETKPNQTPVKNTPNSPLKTRYEPTSHSTPNVSANQHAGYDMTLTNQSVPVLTNQSESYEMQQYEEQCQSIPHAAYIQPDQPAVNMTKATPPLQIQDNHIRPVPISEPLYQPVQQGYTYPQHCKMEAAMSNAMYQCLIPPSAEENKPQHTHAQEPTFRIDPSYPYCMEQWPSTCTHPHPYTVPYVEPQPLVQAVQNVMLPSHHYQMPPYQPVQWQPGIQPLLAPSIPSNCATPIQKPNTPPNIYLQPDIPIYPQMYPNQQLYPITLPYQNYPYQCIPQIIPNTCPIVPYQQYSIPYGEKKTPNGKNRYPNQPTDEKAQEEKNKFFEKKIVKRNESDIALKIQQIKDQIAALSTNSNSASEKDVVEKKEEYKKRNSGNGILGNHPNNATHSFNRNFNRPTNDETQLTSAARAIVNSIRNMQTKNYYPQSSRPQSVTSDPPEPRPPVDHAPRPAPHEHYKHNHYRNDRGQYRSDVPRRTNNFNSTFRPPHMYRQMAPNTWCRKSPGPFPPNYNTNPRRSPPENRLNKRQ